MVQRKQLKDFMQGNVLFINPLISQAKEENNLTETVLSKDFMILPGLREDLAEEVILERRIKEAAEAEGIKTGNGLYLESFLRLPC